MPARITSRPATAPTTELGDDIAFTTPSGKTNCLTDAQYNGGALACLVELADPPPRPAEPRASGKAGGSTTTAPALQIGSLHGDPGPLRQGRRRSNCRTDQAWRSATTDAAADPTGLFCVNYAHRSAAWFSDAGVEPFGCLQPVTPPPEIGETFSC